MRTEVYEPTSDSDSDSDAENEHHVQQLRVPPLPLLLDGNLVVDQHAKFFRLVLMAFEDLKFGNIFFRRN